MKQRVIRPVYSSPPLHGALLAAAVLSDAQLFTQWEGELRLMATRVQRMRALLADELRRVGAPSPDGGNCAPRQARGALRATFHCTRLHARWAHHT